jgi:hypothetical protein
VAYIKWTIVSPCHSHARVFVSCTTAALDMAYAAPLPVLCTPATQGGHFVHHVLLQSKHGSVGNYSQYVPRNQSDTRE